MFGQVPNLNYTTERTLSRVLSRGTPDFLEPPQIILKPTIPPGPRPQLPCPLLPLGVPYYPRAPYFTNLFRPRTSPILFKVPFFPIAFISISFSPSLVDSLPTLLRSSSALWNLFCVLFLCSIIRPFLHPFLAHLSLPFLHSSSGVFFPNFFYSFYTIHCLNFMVHNALLPFSPGLNYPLSPFIYLLLRMQNFVQ